MPAASSRSALPQRLAGRGGDDRRGGREIEGRGPVSAGPARVDRVGKSVLEGDHRLAQRIGSAGDLVGRLSARGEAAQEFGQEFGIEAGGECDREHAAGLGPGELPAIA